MSAHAPAKYAQVGGASAVPANRQLTIDTNTPARTRSGVAGDDVYDDGYESPDAVNSDTSSSSANSTNGPAAVGDSKEGAEVAPAHPPPPPPPLPTGPQRLGKILHDHHTFNTRTYSPPLARKDHVVGEGSKRLDNAVVPSKSGSRQPRYVTVMGLADADDVSTTAFSDDMAPVTDLDAVTLDALLTRNTTSVSTSSETGDRGVGRQTGKQKKETSIDDDGEDEDADVTSAVSELEAFDVVNRSTPKLANDNDVETSISSQTNASSLSDDYPPVIISAEPPANLRSALKSREGNKPIAKKAAVLFDQRVQVVYQDVLDEHVRQKYASDTAQVVVPRGDDNNNLDPDSADDTVAITAVGDAVDLPVVQPAKLSAIVLPRVSLSSNSGNSGRSAASILGVQRVKPPMSSNPGVSVITLAPPQHNGFLSTDTDGYEDDADARDANRQQQQMDSSDIKASNTPSSASGNVNTSRQPAKLRRTVANTDSDMVQAAIKDAVASYDNEPRGGSNSRSRPSTDDEAYGFLPPSRTDGAAVSAAVAAANKNDVSSDRRLVQTLPAAASTVMVPQNRAAVVVNNNLQRSAPSSTSYPSPASVPVNEGKSSSLPYKTHLPSDAVYNVTKSSSLPPNAVPINADKHFAPQATSAGRHDHWQRQFDAAYVNGNVTNNGAWPEQVIPDRRLVSARDSPTLANNSNNYNGRVPMPNDRLDSSLNGQYVAPPPQMQSSGSGYSRSAGNISNAGNPSWKSYPNQQRQWPDTARGERSNSFTIDNRDYLQVTNNVARQQTPPGDANDTGYINAGQTNNVMMRLGVVKRGDKWRSSLTREAGNQMREQRREAARQADASSIDSSSLPMSLPGNSQVQRNDIIRQSQRPAAAENVRKIQRHKVPPVSTPPSSYQQQPASQMRLARMPDEFLNPQQQQPLPPPPSSASSQTPSGTRLARMPDEIMQGVAPYSTSASYTPAFMAAGNFITPTKAPPPPPNASREGRERQQSFGHEPRSMAATGATERSSSAGHGAGGRTRRRSGSEVGRQSSFASTTHIMKVMQSQRRQAATLDNRN